MQSFSWEGCHPSTSLSHGLSGPQSRIIHTTAIAQDVTVSHAEHRNRTPLSWHNHCPWEAEESRAWGVATPGRVWHSMMSLWYSTKVCFRRVRVGNKSLQLQPARTAQNLSDWSKDWQDLLESASVKTSATPNQGEILPLLQSQYKNDLGPGLINLSPLNLSKHISRYWDWLVNWITSLIPLISVEGKRKLFQVCLLALK